ncbi:dolichyl-diphosphooligosaccharide--protein glycosyltransferase subunit 4 [Rhodotorula paludigena]|uniref:dolichyl-diphosphooligosaccharide--protein glycosyltransferase subunit 4 n=1 Tax=Rhodotorula paludigena TaxID=86838 RepID=UPI0031734C06
MTERRDPVAVPDAEAASQADRGSSRALTHVSVISDVLLTNLANTFGTLAVAGIVVYQFLEVNAKRENERIALASAQQDQAQQ